MRKAPIIAIDGPAGSGKSTAARNVAQALGFTYLDTGAMYRAVTWKAIESGLDLADEQGLVDLTARIDIAMVPDSGGARVFVDGVEVTGRIRSEEVSREAYHVAGSARCRERIVALQRRMAADGGVVAEGRDIGTVVFPDADLKLFLVASPEERARRRVGQLRKAGQRADLQQVLRDIELRDRRDTEREVSPLRQAPDAVLVDTTGNTVEQTLDQLLQIVAERFPNLPVRRAAAGPGGAGSGGGGRRSR